MCIEKSVKEKAGSCFGCPDWPGSSEEECGEGREWKPINKKNSPACYTHIVGVLNSHNVKDEWDNVETKYC